MWRREGLKVPGKQPKRGRFWLNDGSCIRLRAERAAPYTGLTLPGLEMYLFLRSAGLHCPLSEARVPARPFALPMPERSRCAGACVLRYTSPE